MSPFSVILAVPVAPPIDCSGTLTSVALVSVPETVSGLAVVVWILMLRSRSPLPALMINVSSIVAPTAQP